jgi:predicted nucleic acid-binding protein
MIDPPGARPIAAVVRCSGSLSTGEIGAALGKKGIAVKTLDLLIATVALAHGVPLLTLDTDVVLIKRAGFPLSLL